MRITSAMGSRVPPPVKPLPAPVCRSVRVVVTTIETGRPLCWPSFPEAISARSPASSPSWLRWAWLRVSRSMAAASGVVSMTGVWSSGLVAPGAASLASTASKVARAWGVS
ncbi:Uncharacterised protein [Mycobacterium tuberculosis]|nr:Uncharacterised protein [Mycobacterium tuberculosis]